MWGLSLTGRSATHVQTPLTLSTSFNEPLYWLTSKSMMICCPSRAALKTGVRPHYRRHSTQTIIKGRVEGSAQRTCHHRSSALTMVAVQGNSQELFCINTHTINRLFSLHESHPLQPRSPAPLVTCMHSHHTTLNTQHTTDNVPTIQTMYFIGHLRLHL